MAVNRGPRIVSDGLVLCLDAADGNSYSGSGATWYDMSGNNYNAALINTPTFETEKGGVFSFSSASSENAAIPYTSSLAPTSQITFECIAYLANWSTTTNMRFLSKTEAGGYQMTINEGTFVPSGYTGALVYYGGGYRNAKVLSSTLSSGYHHLTATCDGRYLIFYVDGISKNTYDHGSTAAISYAVSNAFIVAGEAGSGASAAGQYLNGKIGLVRVYNRALSALEVLQNYNASKERFNI